MTSPKHTDEDGPGDGSQFDPGGYWMHNVISSNPGSFPNEGQTVLGGLFVVPNPANPKQTTEFWALTPNYQRPAQGSPTAVFYRAEHAWNSPQDMYNALTQLGFVQLVKITASCQQTAP